MLMMQNAPGWDEGEEMVSGWCWISLHRSLQISTIVDCCWVMLMEVDGSPPPK
jgi:hypothetical protein